MSFSLGDLGDFLGGIGSLGTAAYGIYKGSQDSARADKLLATTGEYSNKMAEVSADQWNWYKEVQGPLEKATVAENLRDLSLYRDLKEKAVGEYVDSIGRYAPLEKQLTDEAAAGVPLRRLMDQASTDVAAGFGAAGKALEREAASYGLNPASGAWGAQRTNLSLGQALAEAGGRTSARQQGEDLNRQLRYNALNYRKGIPLLQTQATQGQSGQLALNSLAGATNAASGLAKTFADSAAGYNQGAMYSLGLGLPKLGNSISSYLKAA